MDRNSSEYKLFWLSAIIESSQDSIISEDLDGTILGWNPAAFKMFSFTESEAVGKHISIIIPEEYKNEEKDLLVQVKLGRRIEHYETIRKTKDERLINVSLTLSPIKNQNDEVIGASKIVRNISDQKTSFQKQALLSAIVNSSDDAIISKTVDGIITSWNKGAERIFGYKENEAIGKHIFLIIPEDLRSDEILISSRIKAGKSIEHFETERIRKDGRRISLSLTVSPIKNEIGVIIGASKIARDITEQKAMQKTLAEQAAKLKELNNSKDEFISIASHELKTPITSIKAYLQLLERNSSDEIQKTYLGKTLGFVEKLTELVSDLLDISKIEAGKLQLNISDFNMDELIDEALESVQHTTKTHKIIREGSLCSLNVKGDKRRIEQIIINFLTNAIKYSPKANKVIVKCSVKDGFIIVGVKDFGIGIPEEQKSKIFTRFYRVEGLSPTFSGLGIGLYISREIAERHNGKTWVETKLGEGSEFYFSLPVSEK
jgi:PAS domain S-box-containing protein